MNARCPLSEITEGEDGFSRLRLGNEIDVEAVFFCFYGGLWFNPCYNVRKAWAFDDDTIGGNGQCKVSE